MLYFEDYMYVPGVVKVSFDASVALAADGVEYNAHKGIKIPHGSPCLALLRHKPGNPSTEGLLKVVGEEFCEGWYKEEWGME